MRITLHSPATPDDSGFTVRVSGVEVAEFAKRWPGSGLTARSLTFAYDARGNLTDSNEAGRHPEASGDAVFVLVDNARREGIRHRTRKAWTLWRMREANEAAGFYWFSRDSMRFFGDTMASFAPYAFEDGGPGILRMRAGLGVPAGKLYRFNPATGDVRAANEGDA